MYTNIANYIYDIIDTTLKKDIPDFLLGLAHVRAEQEIPEGITDKQLRLFLNHKQKVLRRLYDGGNKTLFVAIVEDMVADYLAPGQTETDV